MNADENAKPKIVILGGGYAGMTVATRLATLAESGRADVTLVNKSNYHYLTTLLHHAILRPISYKSVAVDIPDMLGDKIRFLRGNVVRIEREARTVAVEMRSGRQELEYDILVIALGWEPLFYHIPGLRENSFVLEDLHSAHNIYDHIEQSFQEYDNHPEETWRTHILIGGAGPTGIEVAFELAEGLHALAEDYDVKRKELKVSLVGQVLQGFDEELKNHVIRHLRREGVEVHPGAMVEKVEPHSVEIKGEEELAEGVIIWAGGVRGNSLLEKNGFTVSKRGRAEVDAFLKSTDSSNIYIIGDCAGAKDANGKELVETAQFASQQGRYVAASIQQVLEGEEPEPYVPKNLGMFVTMGRSRAIGVLYLGNMRLKLKGRLGRIAKFAANNRYLWNIGGLKLVLKKLLS